MEDEAREHWLGLEERLERATTAAERLISQSGQHQGAQRPPPAGWQPPPEERPPGRATADLETLVAALAPLRDLIPPDAADRLLAAVKELLLAIRAVIDYYLERLDRRPREPPEIQDIPLK